MQTHMTTLAELVAEFKNRGRVSILDFKVVVETLAATNMPELIHYKFLLSDIARAVYFRADTNLVDVCDIIFQQAGTRFTADELAGMRGYMCAETADEVEHKRQEQPHSDPYEMGCPDVVDQQQYYH